MKSTMKEDHTLTIADNLLLLYPPHNPEELSLLSNWID